MSGGHRRRWAGIAASVVALVLLPAAAAADTIDFEDRTAGQTVNAQYSGQGVTFNGPVARAYAAGFAHSGTKAVENCFGVEFCGSPPIRADFTTGQTTVGVWVGVTDNNPGFGSRSIRLTAFDAGAAEVGHQDVTLAPGSPVASHLTVTSGSANIRALEVTPADSGGSYDIVVDDVEFSAAGPPPPCGAVGPPTINFFSPADQTFVHNNQILLKGTVNGRGAPITDATVVSAGSTTRTAIGFPTPIGPNGGQFAINMNGLLQLGNQKLHVTATNCAGTGVSNANPIVTYSPLPAGAGFQQLAAIEVVQTVQGPFNPVPLVASPNGTKRTIARVFLNATGVTSPIANVSGQLTATRPDGTQLGGPLRVDSLNTIAVGANRTLADARRGGIDGSLNFELPPEWIGAGRLHLQLEHLLIEGQQSALPCQFCDNAAVSPYTVTFHTVPPARIWLVGIPYSAAPGGVSQTWSPRQQDFDFLASWLRRAYPTADVQITQSALPLTTQQPGREDDPDTPGDQSRAGFLCDDVNDRLGDFIQTIPAQPAQTKYYGVVSDANGQLFMRGCSNIGGRTGSGPAGCCGFGWDTDSVYTDWYGGHEIGHIYDRKHPDGGCEDSDDDGSFPFLGGHIGDTFSENQGVDVGDASLSPVAPLAVYDWPTWTDVMTYCDNEWLSSYTYSGILRNICNGDRPNCPDRARLTRARLARKRGGPRLAIQGEIDLDSERVRLDPMSTLRGLTLTERPRHSRYAIVLRDNSGKAFKTYRFEPKEISDQDAGPRRATIDEVVKFSKRTARIEVTGGGKVLAARKVSAHAPRVELRSLKDRTLDAPVKLRWRARDADGGRLLSTLQYAADGKRFVTIAASLHRHKLTVDPATLPGGERARFRVVVTDGVLTGIDRSKRVAVAPKPPRISIATPVEGAVVTDDQSVQLIASVSDDRDLHPGDGVVWSSDLQGELGRGQALATELQPGTHAITATVTNSLGLTSTATVHVDVEAIPPTVDAQLTP